MSSRRQRSIPLGGRYRQVSLYKKSFQGPNANNFNRGYKSLVSDKTTVKPVYNDHLYNIIYYL